MAKIGDFVTAMCFIPNDDLNPQQVRQGILAVQDPDRRHRVILGCNELAVWVAIWNQEIVVIDDHLIKDDALMSFIFDWRRNNARQ